MPQLTIRTKGFIGGYLFCLPILIYALALGISQRASPVGLLLVLLIWTIAATFGTYLGVPFMEKVLRERDIDINSR